MNQSRTQSPQALWPAVGRQETNRWPKNLKTLGRRLVVKLNGSVCTNSQGACITFVSALIPV